MLDKSFRIIIFYLNNIRIAYALSKDVCMNVIVFMVLSWICNLERELHSYELCLMRINRYSSMRCFK